MQEDNINNYDEAYLGLTGNIQVPQGGQKSSLLSYSLCKELPLATQNWQKDYVSLSFPEEEQGESLGAAEIGEALGCYALVPEKGSSWARSHKNRGR